METYLSYRERFEIKKREHIAVIKRRIVFISLAVFIFFMSVFFLTQYASAGESINRHKTFTSVEIQSGDTLWSIATAFYTDDYKNISAYIDEIMKTNKLADENITAGAYLIVPYYTEKTESM